MLHPRRKKKKKSFFIWKNKKTIFWTRSTTPVLRLKIDKGTEKDGIRLKEHRDDGVFLLKDGNEFELKYSTTVDKRKPLSI